MSDDIFNELFVLEVANNHLGKVERGLKIIQDFSKVARFNGVKAAIKLQFRDVSNFVHKDFQGRTDIRYVKKTIDTRLTTEEYTTLAEAIRQNNCLRMATPFDEASVDLCQALNVDIIKLASSDLNDWILIERIAKTRKPVIASTGGSTQKDVDDLVRFFENRSIPLALNHCVSLYPTEDRDLQMNQVDYLARRYPGHVIGFSTHEYRDWTYSMVIAYAKGARTFERHVDVDMDDVAISPYCSRPEDIDRWFKAFLKAKEMCGAPGTEKRMCSEQEVRYLHGLVRGVYARDDLPPGHALTDEDVYLAIPLQRGQISGRELTRGEILTRACPKDAPITIDMFENPYSRNESLRAIIEKRGL